MELEKGIGLWFFDWGEYELEACWPSAFSSRVEIEGREHLELFRCCSSTGGDIGGC